MAQVRTKYYDSKSGITVIVECCDLLKQKGLKIIHTTDTFDTSLDIIKKESLHGSFLTYCNNNNIDVESMLNNTLSKVSPVSEDEHLPGHKNRYALGSVVDFTLENGSRENPLKDYRFVSFAHLSNDGQNNVSISIILYVYGCKDMTKN